MDWIIQMRLVPIVQPPYHVICLVLSIFPGVGTILAGALTKEYKTVGIGIIQYFLGIFWFTWPLAFLWSFIWGILIFEVSENCKF